MSKWFEEIDSRNSNVIYSRIRLARNWDAVSYTHLTLPTICSV